MLRSARHTLVSILLIGCFAAVARAGALAPGVRDEAAYFKPQTVQKANEEIKDLQRELHKDLLIETFKTVPADKVKAVRGMGRAAREDFFARWAEERARAEGVDGVYVLMCKSPPFTQVSLGPETDDQLFPDGDRQRLADLLANHWSSRRYDQDLLDAIGFVRIRLNSNINNPSPPQKSWNGLVLLWIVLGILGLWVVIGVLRALVSYLGREPVVDNSGPAPGVRLLGGLVGALFGKWAGRWLRDAALNRWRQPPKPATPAPAAGLDKTLPYPTPNIPETIVNPPTGKNVDF
jgi:hypothetical protein